MEIRVKIKKEETYFRDQVRLFNVEINHGTHE